MKKGLTQLVFILDRSGSMAGLESDTIGGYNSLLEKQKKEEGEAIVTTVLFDDQYELLHDRINMNGVAPISEKEYYVRGSTALLDAIGNTIRKIGSVQKHTTEEERAEKVLFVITTDGMENASRHYGYNEVKGMIEHQKERYGWEFLFLGANIDAVETAEKFGIRADRAVSYHADKRGTRLNYDVMCETITHMRTNRDIPADWKNRIDEDYNSREKE